MTERRRSRLLDGLKPVLSFLVLLAFFISALGQAYLPLTHLEEIGQAEGKVNQGPSSLLEESQDSSHHHSETCSTCQLLRLAQASDLPAPVSSVLQDRLVEAEFHPFESTQVREPALHGAESRGPPFSL